MGAKIFRDPLYNYVSIDRKSDQWLVDLLDCPEFQRLRRIHQLGVSSFTYPGAEHSRLSHSLGVLHLMQAACDRLRKVWQDTQVANARAALLAAAVLHDVGHGPFSHVFEPCLEIDHEEWSRKIILSEESKCHQVLAKIDRFLPQRVAALVDPDNNDEHSWMKYLLSSQLDVDRLDYLQRDSFFTGAGYGHFDWFRIIGTFELYGDADEDRTIVWPKKAAMAVEEYVFARYYMYQNVYLHKTTRGFEKLLAAMWRRARDLDRQDASLLPSLAEFWAAAEPSVEQYLAIEEFTVLQQIQNWTGHGDRSLSDLARRFLSRHRLVCIDPPASAVEQEKTGYSAERLDEWDRAVRETVAAAGFDPEVYCLKDEVKPKYHQPYFPEKEGDVQSAKNAIRILPDDNSPPIEISQIRDRLKPVTREQGAQVRHYVPEEVRAEVRQFAARF